MDNMDNNTLFATFFKENLDKINNKFTDKEFMDMDIETKRKKAIELKLDFKFVLSFYDTIQHLFRVIKTFVETSNSEDINSDDETIAYLTICTLAIAFGNPKETYRKLFTELRMRNVYGILKDLTLFVEILNNIFSYATDIENGVSYGTIGMFNQPEKLKGMLSDFNYFIVNEKLKLEDIINCISEDGVLKFSESKIGDTDISINDIILKMAEKISTDVENIKKDLKSKSRNNTTHDVLSWSDWKDSNGMSKNVERIDEEI